MPVDLRKFKPIRDVAQAAFADGVSARIGRMLSMTSKNRAPQQWMSDDAGPEDVVDRLAAQVELIAKLGPQERIEAIVAELQAAGLEDEVIASFLSRVYGRLTGVTSR